MGRKPQVRAPRHECCQCRYLKTQVIPVNPEGSDRDDHDWRGDGTSARAWLEVAVCDSVPAGRPAAGVHSTATRDRCVSIILDKNRRYIGKSQSKRPPKRTQRTPHPPGSPAASSRPVRGGTPAAAAPCASPAAAAAPRPAPARPAPATIISSTQVYFMVRTAAMTEIPLRFCSFHDWFLY
jgi:hypothetical protein